MQTMRGELNEVGCIWKSRKIGVGIKPRGARIVKLRCSEQLAQQAALHLYREVEVEHADGIAFAVRAACIGEPSPHETKP